MILGADPLFEGGHVGFVVLLFVIVKTFITFALLLLAVMLMIWFERKIIGDMQNRIGPNRAGPFGILQTLADGVKLMIKEDIIPNRADRLMFRLAPYLVLLPAFLTFAVVPLSGNFAPGTDGVVKILGHHTRLQLVDPPIGMLFVLAMGSIAVYGVLLAGWASGSKYPLLSGVRASAQMISYEAALGLSVATVFLVTGQLTTSGIVGAQYTWGWNLWVTGLVPFIVFFIASLAEHARPPFDIIEAEQELTGGFNTEYSSFRFAIFYLAEFMNAITLSAIVVTLFLGGPNGWYPPGPEWIWGLVWFFGKMIVLLYVLVWIRGTLPRLRYDQLMDLGWKVLIPLSLGWLLLLAAVRIGDDRNWNLFIVVPVVLVMIVAVAGLLAAAIKVGRSDRALAEVFE
jgi:NADH-quinone oxidoreductase subunit H